MNSTGEIEVRPTSARGEPAPAQEATDVVTAKPGLRRLLRGSTAAKRRSAQREIIIQRLLLRVDLGDVSAQSERRGTREWLTVFWFDLVVAVAILAVLVSVAVVLILRHV